MLPDVGDMIRSRGETGIVCFLDPPIMRTTQVKTYVIFNPREWTLVQRGAEQKVTIKEELVERIRRYMETNGVSFITPTGNSETQHLAV